jgi:predicted DNA binding CopG/RHH family protein
MSKMKKRIFDDEQAMISELEAGGYEPVSNETSEIDRITKIFRENGTKVKRVNIRMTQRDVDKAQAIAIREGIPYATLLTNILHRYLTGRLKEVR